MTTAARGLFWCFIFLILDAVQAVFFGATFQRLDSFLVGALVFGLSASACLAWTLVRRPDHLARALADPGALAGLNVTAAGAWLTYLLAIQRIEPAIAFTLFSGIIPIATVAAGRSGFTGAPAMRNRLEAGGYLLIAAGMTALAAITLAGWSGFVRGSVADAGVGLALATLAGVMIAFMLLYSRRLDMAGVGPLAQFGLRFPLYTVLATTGFLLGFDDKGPAPAEDLLLAFVVGLAVLAFPIYAVQKAVSLTSTLTIGTFAAVGPFVVFVLQVTEGRVAYAQATLVGLAIYFAGALLGVFGTVRAASAGNRRLE